MANDIPEPQARVLAAVPQPIAASAFGDKPGEAAWYPITVDDHALSPAVQTHFVGQAGANVARRIHSGHLPMAS